MEVGHCKRESYIEFGIEREKSGEKKLKVAASNNKLRSTLAAPLACDYPIAVTSRVQREPAIDSLCTLKLH